MKQLFIIILIGTSLLSMEEKKISLSPIQKLSLLDSIRKGSLVIHQDFYECSSFINDTNTHESTYIIHRKRSNDYLKEFLKTETIREDDYNVFAFEWFTDKHPEVLKHETCPPQIQEKCLTLWTQDLKHASLSHPLQICMQALINNNGGLSQRYLAWLKEYYEYTHGCIII